MIPDAHWAALRDWAKRSDEPGNAEWYMQRSEVQDLVRYIEGLAARLRAAEQREQELVELAWTAIDRLRTTYGDWDFADELAKAVGGNTP